MSRTKTLEAFVIGVCLKCLRDNKMTQFLLFVMTTLLILIFWELSKIHTRLKRALRAQMDLPKQPEETTKVRVA
jgi:hypothetical protein